MTINKSQIFRTIIFGCLRFNNLLDEKISTSVEEEAEECSTNSDSKDSKEVEESGDAVPELLNISRTRCRIELETMFTKF